MLALYKMDNFFPPGLKFLPDNLQVVQEYLLNKAKNMPLFEGFVKECDIYSTEPWNLPNDEFKYGVGSEAYYFTKRSRKKSSRTRIDRTAGEGTWVENGQRKPIKNPDDDKVVGHVTHFSFRRANEKAASNWIMDEFTSTDPQCQEWVVCRVKLNARGEKRKREEKEGAQKTENCKKAKTGSHFSESVTKEGGGGELAVVSARGEKRKREEDEAARKEDDGSHYTESVMSEGGELSIISYCFDEGEQGNLLLDDDFDEIMKSLLCSDDNINHNLFEVGLCPLEGY